MSVPPPLQQGPLPPHLLSWLKGLGLSQPLRSVRRDWCSGYLVAEILSRYYSDVSMASFGSYGSLERKRSNWDLLQKLFQKGEIPIKDRLVQSVLNAEEGAAVKLLEKLHAYLEVPGEGSSAAATEPSQFVQPAEVDPATSSNPSASPGSTSPTSQGTAAPEPQPLSWPPPLGQQQTGLLHAADTWLAVPTLGPEPGAAGYPAPAAWNSGGSYAVGLQEGAPIGAAEAVSPADSLAGSGLLGADMVPGYLAAAGVEAQPQLTYAAAGPPAALWGASGPGAEWAPAAPGRLLSAHPGSLTAAVYEAAAERQYLQHCYTASPALPPHAAALPALSPEAVGMHGYGWPHPQDSTAYLPSPLTHQPLQQSTHLPALQQRPGKAVKVPQRKPPALGQQPTTSWEAETLELAISQQVQPVAPPHPAAAAASPEPEPPADAKAPLLPSIEYDRRPRPVHFKPHTYQEYTLKEYDIKQAKGYWELGRLGPDYHDDAGWRQKWERLERQKEFGQRARAVNQKKAAEHSSSSPRRRALSCRERALEFAKSVPKPEAAGQGSGSSRTASAQVAEQLSRLQLQKRVSARDAGGLADMIRSELAAAAAAAVGSSQE